MEFAYNGGEIGKGGLATLCIDGQKVGSRRVEEAHMMAFSGDEPRDVGREAESPVSPDYGPRDNEFNGEVKMGADRSGPGRPKPSDYARTANWFRNGAAVNSFLALPDIERIG